ncbi:EAL domain-containing protein [Clostridium sp. CS001]|uniref:putative bifunctional diguanylate cyclase/phosphodiesterase n=1 Tax=Clostridium sp. CS001 TaxID=2880648 RepID=UPI001CF334DF|nr:EAL domain-containing protein [Clostridium sp. CS001]MCB2289372.1 EAL domain-containing protein [Clostridium sp. CS001]
MHNKDHKIKNIIVNKYKLIYIPLVIGLLAIVIISVISFYTSKSLLLEQMKLDGITLAKKTVSQLDENEVSLELINKMVEDKIRTIAKATMANEESLSNDLLKDIASTLVVAEINYYSSDGKVIFSNIESYVGWQSPKDHPVEKFRISGMDELMEDIRKDTESNNYNKYGYFRNSDGSFIQVGIRANEIESLTYKFNFQNLVEKLAQGENILNVLIIDKNLNSIADSTVADIGMTHDKDNKLEMQKALDGVISAKDSYYKKNNANVLTIYVPVFLKGEINNALVLCLSTEKVYSSIYMLFIKSTIIAIIMLLILLFAQHRNVIRPVTLLDHGIDQIDIEKNIRYRLPIVENDTFFGVVSSINKILDKTDNYFFQLKEHEEELQASNEELSATYQQLAASDEELRAQFDEITEQGEYISHLAYHDSLTNLPNRRKFINMLEAQLNDNRFGAVILLDLDNFKVINDTLGHTYGDRVLKRVAEELSNIKDEKVYVSRFGGDEFFILIQNEKDILQIESYAKNIINIFGNRLLIEGDMNYISCSIGITLYPFDSNCVDQLLMNADMAMYKVKNSSKNNYMFFNQEMTTNLQTQIKIEKILRAAIELNELKLLYQPQVCSNTGALVGFEALLRLKDHHISPAEFIPVAEETGIIIEIGRWVTRETIKQIATWKDKGFILKPIAINFSAKQLNDLSYVTFLTDTLREFHIDAKYINIEITESIFLEKKEETIKFLNELRALGIKIALDDFGTGYSSLSYLTFLPVDKIKLDKSLNDKFLELENIKVMDSLISLAHSLNLEVVAEGIEDVQHFNRLKVAGCNYIQGYLFSKPLEVDDAEKIYNDNFLDKLIIKSSSSILQ